MPYVNSQGVRIHYQVEGEGPPLVLQHGFTDSLESWYEFGYVPALKPDYRLILLDARGHGASEKPHEPAAYQAKLHVADILAVLDALHIPKASFCGYSMGGRIGFASAQYAPARFSSFIIGGSQPSARLQTQADPLLQMLRKGLEALEWDAPLSPALKARLLANDRDALIACRLKQPENFEEVLPTMTMPCLLFAGEADRAYAGVKECVRYLPNATCFFLPGLTHAETFFRSDLVLPHLTQFLATVPV
jgi:pimeloyl-ACP methyl ester carboxylesterase